MTELNQDLFEKYLRGTLSKSETDTFELALEKDSELKNEFLMYKELDTALTDKDAIEVETIMNTIVSNHPLTSEEKSNSRKLLYLVFLILGLLAAWLIYSNSSKSQASETSAKGLYASYYEPYEAYGIERAQDSKSAMDLALIAYGNQEYLKAIAIYEDSSKKSIKDKFYYASALLSSGYASKALVQFTTISESGNKEWTEQSLWFKAMCELALDQRADAKATLKKLPKSSSFYSKADMLLNALK